MPFVIRPSDAAVEVYLQAVREHNAATCDTARFAAGQRGAGALAVISAIYGSTAAGMLIAEADLMVMAEVGEDKMMCGGMLLEPAPPQAEPGS